MSVPIRVAIRADAGAALGTGHFARASAVADALSADGGTEIVLVTDAEGAALVPAFFPSDMTVLELAPDDIGPEGSIRALRRAGWTAEVIFLDQYGSVPEWEMQAASAGMPLLVIDDLDAAKQADVIVRPHGGPETGGDTIVLRGPAYLPLSRHVTEMVRNRPPDSDGRLRLNVCFGGSDPTGETAKALQVVATLEGIEVDVVIGPGARFDPALTDTVGHMPHVTLHRAPSQEQLTKLLAEADLALGAGGVMLWERLCLGVPSLVIAAADNQRPQIDTMVAAGAIQFLGDHFEVTPKNIAEAVTALAADEATRKAFAEIGQKLVDGRGASRLAAWIGALALGLRDVQTDDARDLLNWRTDDQNWQHNWGDAEKPGFDAHVAWLGAMLADPACVFRIVTRGTEPVGVVRFDLDDAGASAHLSIYLVPVWHGRRMGLPVYFAAERALRQSHPGVNRIISRIHRANAPSERMHRDAGFEVLASRERADWFDAWKVLN